YDSSLRAPRLYSQLTTQKASEGSQPQFDILKHYTNLLLTDSEITMPVAAIESLVALVDACQATTVSEFISIIQAGSDTLKSSVSNAISLSAGCDLFMRYIIQTLGNVGDIASCRDYLRNNGRLFVHRAKDARR